MTSVYNNLDITSLRQILSDKAKVRNTLGGAGNEDELQAVDVDITTIANLIKTILLTQPDNKNNVFSSDSQLKQEKLIVLREIKSSVDNVPKFSVGSDVHVFINQLENIHRLHVQQHKNDENVENAFLRASKQLLADSYLTQMLNSSEETNTFETFRSYLVKTHSSKLTHFQRLNKLWEVCPKSSESMVDTASRLENLAHEVLTSLVAVWKLRAPSDTDIPSKNLLDLVLGQIMLTHIASSKHKDTYKYIVSDLDTCWTASEVAAKAATIIDRCKNTDVPSIAAFHVGNKSNDNGGIRSSDTKSKFKKNKTTPNKNQDCYFYIDGNCKKGEQCGWKHDPAKFNTGRKRSNEQTMSMISLPNFQ